MVICMVLTVVIFCRFDYPHHGINSFHVRSSHFPGLVSHRYNFSFSIDLYGHLGHLFCQYRTVCTEWLVHLSERLVYLSYRYQTNVLFPSSAIGWLRKWILKTLAKYVWRKKLLVSRNFAKFGEIHYCFRKISRNSLKFLDTNFGKCREGI
jgi:hypothetical protein